MSGRVVVRFVDERLGIASCGPVFLNVVRAPVDMPLVCEMERHVADHAAANRGAYSTLSVIEPAAAKRQDKQATAAAGRIGHQFQVLRAAIVAEGEGFRAAAIRTALTAMYLLKPPKYPYKIFAASPQGARWLVEQGAGATETELLEAIRTIRRSQGGLP
jgi:hypothetical protein